MRPGSFVYDCLSVWVVGVAVIVYGPWSCCWCHLPLAFCSFGRLSCTLDASIKVICYWLDCFWTCSCSFFSWAFPSIFVNSEIPSHALLNSFAVVVKAANVSPSWLMLRFLGSPTRYWSIWTWAMRSFCSSERVYRRESTAFGERIFPS